MEGVRLLRVLYSFSRRCNRLSVLGQTMRDLHNGFNIDNLIKERMRQQLLAETNALKKDDATSDIGKSSQQAPKASKNHSPSEEKPKEQTVETGKSIPNISAANISVSGLNVKKSSSTAPKSKNLRDASKLNSKPLKKKTFRSPPISKTAGEKIDETARIGKFIEKDSSRSQTTSRSASKITASEKASIVPIKKPNLKPAKPKNATKPATTSSVQGTDTPKTQAISSTPKEQQPMDGQEDQLKTRYKVLIETFTANKPNLQLRGNALIIESDRTKKELNTKCTNTNGLTPVKPTKK